MKRYTVIVAGGSGSRMKSKVSKQYLLLAGKPILMHTLSVFYNYDATIDIILVLPAHDQAYWQSLVRQYHFDIPHTLVQGGATRFQSVKNGLSQIKADGIVAIHDGVRPLLAPHTLEQLFTTAQQQGNATACVAMKESLRHVDPQTTVSRAVNRTAYKVIQTPQVFRVPLIQQAFQAEETDLFTDDASVFEYAGHKIVLVNGEYSNIKITTPEDLRIAEALLRKL